MNEPFHLPGRIPAAGYVVADAEGAILGIGLTPGAALADAGPTRWGWCTYPASAGLIVAAVDRTPQPWVSVGGVACTVAEAGV